MLTGQIENWTGSMLDIGPLYPFVGSEMLLWVIGMVLWIAWHVWQAKAENREYEEQMQKYTQGENLQKAMRGEKIG